MIKNDINYSKLTKISTVLIVIAPLFSQYSGFVSFLLLPELWFLILMPFYILNTKKFSFIKYRFFLLFLFFVPLISLSVALFQQYFDVSEFLKAYLRYAFYFLIIILVGNKYFDIKLGVKVYKVIALINSVYLFIQFGFYSFLGTILPWYIKGLPIKQGTRLITDYNYIFSQYGYRPSGLFFEPAHFAHYVVPALLIILFYEDQGVKKNSVNRVIYSLIFTSALLISGSGTAVIMTGIVWGIWVIKKIKITLKSFISITIIFLMLVYIIQIPLVQNSINRITADNELSSRNVRITRGFAVYEQLSLPNKIFGVGYGNYATYVNAYNIKTDFDLGDSSYVNTMAYMLVGTGFIGFFLYLLIYSDLFKRTKGFYRYRTLILFISGFFSGNPLSVSFITAVVFIMAGYTLNNKESIK